MSLAREGNEHCHFITTGVPCDRWTPEDSACAPCACWGPCVHERNPVCTLHADWLEMYVAFGWFWRSVQVGYHPEEFGWLDEAMNCFVRIEDDRI